MKYKYSAIILIILLIVFSIVQNKKWDKEKKISDDLMSNNIKFSGIITDLKASRNHSFGVISLKVNEINIKEFSPIIGKDLFPYAIKDSAAEIYTIVSHVIKKGDLVEVDSDKKEVVFSNADGILYTDKISTISEETDIEFVKENSTLIK